MPSHTVIGCPCAWLYPLYKGELVYPPWLSKGPSSVPPLYLFKPCPCPGPELWKALQKHFKICLLCLEELGWQCWLGRKPKAWTGTEMGPESHLFSLMISPVLYSLLLPDPTSIVWTRCSKELWDSLLGSRPRALARHPGLLGGEEGRT